jgi:hypothetical protein
MKSEIKTCRFCGLISVAVCEGICPRMGCDMPGNRQNHAERERKLRDGIEPNATLVVIAPTTTVL